MFSHLNTSVSFYPLIRVFNYWLNHHWYIYHLTVCFLLSCLFYVPFLFWLFFGINQAFLFSHLLLSLLVFIRFVLLFWGWWLQQPSQCISDLLLTWIMTLTISPIILKPQNTVTSLHLPYFLLDSHFHFVCIFKSSSVIDLHISHSLIFILSIILHSFLFPSDFFFLLYAPFRISFFPTWDITDIWYRVSLRCTKW